MNKLSIFFLVFLIAGWYFFSYRITDVPPGINGDEAAIGYNAALVSKTGHDSSGRFLPLFISAFDLTDWKQPVTFYSTVLAFKLFGTTYEMLRQVSVVFVLISAALVFFLSREIFGKKLAFVSLGLFLTIPAILIQSHLALENIAPVPITILWLLMLVKYLKSSKARFLYLSGLFLGIDLFTYPGLRIIFPVYFCLSLGLIFYLQKKRDFKYVIPKWFKFAVVALIFPAIMWSVKNQYPGAILAYNRPHSLPSYQNFFLSYISSYDPSFLFINGDSTPYHSTGKQGVFLLSTLPLFILGLIWIIRKKDVMLWFVLLVFFLSPLLYGLAETIHRGSRLLVMLPPYALITTAGVLSITQIKKRKWAMTVLGILVLLISLNYFDFLRDYYFDYPKRVESQFAKPYQLTFEKVAILAKSKNLNPYIWQDFGTENKIAIDFFKQVMPGDLKSWTENEVIPAHSVIIVPEYILKNRQQVPQDNSGYGFGLLINNSQNEIR